MPCLFAVYTCLSVPADGSLREMLSITECRTLLLTFNTVSVSPTADAVRAMRMQYVMSVAAHTDANT